MVYAASSTALSVIPSLTAIALMVVAAVITGWALAEYRVLAVVGLLLSVV
jgi:hypothetical protein